MSNPSANLPIGHNSLCYEAVQRVFRNALVDYIRVRMAETFPADHVDRLRRIFSKEWESIVAASEAARVSGGTETVVRDEYDLLSVAHFYNIFDSLFDKLFNADAIAKGYVKPQKAKFLGNLKTIKDARDPMSHPVTEEISYQEAFGCILTVKNVLQSLQFETPASRCSALLQLLTRDATDFNNEELPEEPICSLPSQDSIYLEFVGRLDILEELEDILLKSSNRRCLVAGDGGKGKSAIAYRFAVTASKRSTNFRLITWLSAKRKRFEEGRTVAIATPDFNDLGSAIDKLLIQYGELPTSLGSDIESRKSRLFSLLDENPALIIVDDIDTLLEDTEVVSLFTFEIPSTKSKVLLTSRRNIPGIRCKVIQGLELNDAVGFINSRIELYGLDAALFPHNIVKEILSATDGSPLYMDDLLRVAKVMPPQTAIQMWKARQGDEARRYALEKELEKLTSDAKNALLVAAVGDADVSFAEIQSALSISEERMLSALSQLQTLFLLPKPKLVEGEQRYALNMNTRSLIRLVEGESDRYKRIDAALRAIRGKLPDVGKGEIAALVRQAFLLMNAQKFSAAESLMLSAKSKFFGSPEIFGSLGIIYRRWEKWADARAAFQEAHKYKSKNKEVYRNWIKMEMSQHEWNRGIVAADKALALIPNFYDMQAFRAECKVRAGMDLNRSVQREKAIKLWLEAAEELQDTLKDPAKLAPGERWISAYIYKTLVICLDCLQEYSTLEEVFVRWESEHADDANVERQREFLLTKYGISLSDLSKRERVLIKTSHPRNLLTIDPRRR